MKIKLLVASIVCLSFVGCDTKNEDAPPAVSVNVDGNAVEVGAAGIKVNGKSGKVVVAGNAEGGGVTVDGKEGNVKIGANGITVDGKDGEKVNIKLGDLAKIAAVAGKASSASCSPGKTCKFKCPTGNCDWTCGAGATCKTTCSGGNCDLTCDGGTCKSTCSGGNCNQTCKGGSCDFSCSGGNCKHAKVGDATMKTSCTGGNCTK